MDKPFKVIVPPPVIQPTTIEIGATCPRTGREHLKPDPDLVRVVYAGLTTMVPDLPSIDACTFTMEPAGDGAYRLLCKYTPIL